MYTMIACTVFAGGAQNCPQGIEVEQCGSPTIKHSMGALKIRVHIQSSLEVIGWPLNEQGFTATLRATRKFVMQDISKCDFELRSGVSRTGHMAKRKP